MHHALRSSMLPSPFGRGAGGVRANIWLRKGYAQPSMRDPW
jgi:hypothetical protein